MKLSKKNKILKFVMGFFLIILGIVIGIAVRHYHNIPLSETFNIIDIATLITTIFIAVYVPGVLNKQMQIQRDKKEVINQRIMEIQSIYRRINSLIQLDETSERDKITINNSLDIISNRLETIITLLNYLEIKKSFSKEINGIIDTNTKHKNLLYPYIKDNIKISKYPDNIQKEEEHLYNEIDKQTSLLMFKLSDA